MDQDSKYQVRLKKDRFDMLWIKEVGTGRQLCQLRSDHFQALEEGIQLMARVADAVADDPTVDCKALRDQLVQEYQAKNPKNPQVQAPSHIAAAERPPKRPKVANRLSPVEFDCPEGDFMFLDEWSDFLELAEFYI